MACSHLLNDGFDETKLTDYQPGHESELHTHAFSAEFLVLDGEFVLGLENGSQTFGPGEICVVPAGTMHAECTAAVGARVLAGLKHPS